MDSHTGDLESTASLQSVIDSLNGNVAVLDRNGTIQLVNTGWVQFACDNGDPGRGALRAGRQLLRLLRTR